MTEQCKLCQQPNTPWEYIKALKGHVCCDCSYRIASLFLDERNAYALRAAYGSKAWDEVELS